MTIKIPSANIFDKILKILGKERKIIIPEDANEIYKEKGPYVQMQAEREGFFKALFRKEDQ